MNGRRRALVVAVDRDDNPALHRLAGPAADAEALAGVLGDPDLGAFDVDVVLNARSSETCEHVEALFAESRPADLVLLHFSCHGIKDDSGELYLAATNTAPDRLASTAVDAAWVNRLMRRSRAQRVVLLLDCCYGGAFERGLVARSTSSVDIGDRFTPDRLDEGRGRAVITASTAMEYAFEGAQLSDGTPPRPSLFTAALVDGIRTGEADRDRDGHISLGELYDHVYDHVRQRAPNQTPSKWEFGVRGGLYIARAARIPVSPAALPPELLQLIDHPTAGARVAAVEELARFAAGADLPRAAAARVALGGLIDDDSRRVSQRAAEEFERTALRLGTDTVAFGRVLAGTPPVTADVDVTGGPLASASEVSAPETLTARLDAGTLRITWTPAQVGRLDETIALSGPAGEAQVRVTGHVVAPPAPAQPEPEAPPPAALPSRPEVTVSGAAPVEPSVAAGHPESLAPLPPPQPPAVAPPASAVARLVRFGQTRLGLLVIVLLATVVVIVIQSVANRPTAPPADQPLAGHSSGVYGVAFSRDGRTLASAGMDHTVRLWDLGSRRERGQPLTAHNNWVMSVAFSPDEKTIASGSLDGTVRLWDVARREQLGDPLTGHKGAVYAVAFSRDGKTLATGGKEGTVLLWDVATRPPRGKALTGHNGDVYGLAFSPNGKILASAGEDRTIRLWNGADGRYLGPLATLHTGAIHSLAFSPDSRTIASASVDKTVRLWAATPAGAATPR